MRNLMLILATTALFTGSAVAQDNTGSSKDPNAVTGSSNAAVNAKGNAASDANPSGTVNIVAPSALEKGANSFTEGQARGRIEGAGFSGVTGLHKDDQGIWRGKATRDGKQVDVGFDYKGNIGVQ